ncbi:unnamed protein product [Colias eurytheme]|nr:unnamed protein product [Colias eurytheme]
MGTESVAAWRGRRLASTRYNKYIEWGETLALAAGLRAAREDSGWVRKCRVTRQSGGKRRTHRATYIYESN